MPQLAAIRWTKPQKYHITFGFFPNLDPKEIDHVRSKVQELSQHFPLQGRAIAFSGFPRPSRARVLILRVDLAAFPDNLFTDANPKPHITVGYARKMFIPIEELAVDFPITFESVHLIESKDHAYHVVF